MDTFYPLHVRIDGKKCLVVGGGRTAERKVATLLRYGGKVVLVSPQATSKIRNYYKKQRLVWQRRAFKDSDLNGSLLVFAATGSRALNREIGREARKRSILVNLVDSPEDCDFISPSLVKRGQLTLSISTGGTAPFLSKKIRHDLEKKFGNEYGHYIQLLAKIRSAIVKNKRYGEAEKKKKLDRLLSMGLIGKLQRKEKVSCKTILKQLGVGE